MEIVGHEETTAQEVFAKHFRLRRGQSPFARLDGIEPRPVEHFVPVFQIHGLLDGARLHKGQTANRLGQIPVRTRVILGPEGEPLPPVAVEPAAIAIVGARRIHQSGEGPLALLLPVRRQLDITVFNGGIIPERALKSIQCGAQK